MNSGLNANDPVVVAAFRSALIHQGVIAVLIFALLSIVWVAARGWLPARNGTATRPGGRAAASAASSTGTSAASAAARPTADSGSRATSRTSWPAGPGGRVWVAEPAGRRLLRIGFGILWIFDGLLQAQPAMAVGLPSQVIKPTAASSPLWVQRVVNWGGTTWSYHPIQAGAAAVWIQVGLGIWLLAAVGGLWSRLAGLASVGWGLVVWVWGESFGGIFAPGLTWLFGAPGAVLFYCAAGALIALPERYWLSPRLGRAVLAVLGVFFAGMAVLQAWPGRGFWQGVSHGQPGTLVGMTATMAQTPQPGFLASWISAFSGFDQAHGFAVNLFVVIAVAAIGAALLAGRPWLLRPVIAFMTVLCLADWVLIEDLGFLGGLGTDPNSMIPMALVVIGGYLALAHVPAPATQPAAATQPAPAIQPAPAARSAPAAQPAAPGPPAPAPAPPRPGQPGGAGRGWWDRFRPAALGGMLATASARSMASAGAVGVILLGAAPMAAAQATLTADPILAQAIAGSGAPVDYSAPGFRLTDQHGKPVSLASLRGKVVLLTFLDPVCTSDCPLIAQEFRATAQQLGGNTRTVELVAITLSPTYRSVAIVNAFDRQEGLSTLPNWLYLTGTLAQLGQVWRAYGVFAYSLPAGGMTGHNDVAFVIDSEGNIRQEFSTNPGPGTAATKASFTTLLTDAAQRALSSP